MDPRYSVGIDLGTTNSAVAEVDLAIEPAGPGEPLPAPIPVEIPQMVAHKEVAGRELLPSFIYLPPAHEGIGESVVGAYARDRGAQVPGRLVSSSKSWLSHPGVDRRSQLLPPDADAETPRISPLEAAARILGQMKQGWDAAHAHEEPVKSLVSGLRYVWGHQTVLMLLLIAFLLNLLAAPYRYAFLPLFARYVLDTGPAGYGILTAAAGFGALVAGLWVVSMGNYRAKGRWLAWSGIAWPAFLLLLAMSTWYSVSLVLVFLAGLAQAMVWTIIATLILSNTAQPMRGRVMGLRTGVVISLPLGNFLGGAAAEAFGAPFAQGIYAVSAILAMAVILLLMPNLRKLD